MKEHDWLRTAADSERARLLQMTVGSEGVFAGHLYSIGSEGEQIVETPCALYFLLEAIMAEVRE